MSPGFFLCLAENTGDGFAYVILPAKEYKDIPLRRNPITLVRCVVRSRDLSSEFAPRCIKEDDEQFKFFNSEGVELFGENELESDPDNKTSEENTTVEEANQAQSSDALPSSSHSFMSLDKLDLSTMLISESN